MIKIYSFLAFIISFNAFSQKTIKGIVVNQQTKRPIKDVRVINITTAKEVFTDVHGSFLVTIPSTIKLSKLGYSELIVEVKNNRILNIELTPKSVSLDEITVNGISIPTSYKKATKALSIISSEAIDKSNGLEFHTLLNRVPGVFMQSGTLNTNRISIRGIGARNLFGTANIRAYYGDIPLTNGNGESAIEDLELKAFSKIEIQKGPSSSSYGVGLGGTILIYPDYHNKNGANSALISSTTGSYGLRRFLAKVGISSKMSSFNVVYSNNHTDGYRDNNTYDKETLTVTSSLNETQKNSFSVLGSYVKLKAGIPSSLNQNDFDNNPRKAAFTWGRSKAYEDVDYSILGANWTHKYGSKMSQNTSVFTTFKRNYEPRPFNILKEKTYGFGMRSRFLGESTLAKRQLSWTAGGEVFYETYNGQTFENLYEDYPIESGSVEGNQLSHLNEKRYYYNVFVEANYQVFKNTKLNIGTHLNQTFYDVKDRFLTDNDDSSAAYNFDIIVSPKLGINYALNSTINVFGNMSHGFSTPTTSETLLPEGDFNPNIKPEIGWNYELGAKFSFLKRIQGAFSIYSLRVKNLLVSRRTVDDRVFAINAGKTVHNGIELEIDYQILKHKYHELKTFINASIYDYRFKEFKDLDNDFSGHNLTGVPDKVINFGVDYKAIKGFYGSLDFQVVGAIPVNDANSSYSKNYELVHGKVGFKKSINKRWNYNIYLGVNNIFDEKYASQIQINAQGFGGNAPRYYYPGLPFNVYGGVALNFLF